MVDFKFFKDKKALEEQHDRLTTFLDRTENLMRSLSSSINGLAASFAKKEDGNPDREANFRRIAVELPKASDAIHSIYENITTGLKDEIAEKAEAKTAPPPIKVR